MSTTASASCALLGGETRGRSCGGWRGFQSVHVSNRRHAYCRLALEVGGSRHFTSPLPSISQLSFWERMASKAAHSSLKNAFVLVTNSIEKGSHPRIMSKSLNSLQLLRPQCASTTKPSTAAHTCMCLPLAAPQRLPLASRRYRYSSSLILC
jgi:hypothetical protein